MSAREFIPTSKYRFQCAGYVGCGWIGKREECWNTHQHPMKCPRCGKTFTFLTLTLEDARKRGYEGE